MINRLIKSTKGVSLPLVTGLVVLLMISSMAVNELIIRTMQSVRRIEASNRAYLAAEAGVEDALYELSQHFAGYETPDLDDTEVRNAYFGQIGNQQWESNWKIESHQTDEDGIPTNTWGGRFYKGSKMMIFLYNDASGAVGALDPNEINQAVSDINTLNIADISNDFSITFTIPDPDTYLNGDVNLRIDNDEDCQLNGVNEDLDGPPDPDGDGTTEPDEITCEDNPEDDDCDGKVNEDNDEDAVIMWKLSDGKGRSLIPYTGCLSESAGGAEKSEICEKDFKSFEYSVTIDEDVYGRNATGWPEKIKDFINATDNDAKLQFEFLIIAPMEHSSADCSTRTAIPYFEYTVNTSAVPASYHIPSPYFDIKSDGYFGTYKQSITTRVSPKTTVPLFDFTIIQQE